MTFKRTSLNRRTTLYVSGTVICADGTQTQAVRNALLTVRLAFPLLTLCSCEEVKAICSLHAPERWRTRSILGQRPLTGRTHHGPIASIRACRHPSTASPSPPWCANACCIAVPWAIARDLIPATHGPSGPTWWSVSVSQRGALVLRGRFGRWREKCQLERTSEPAEGEPEGEPDRQALDTAERGKTVTRRSALVRGYHS
jgi:hypothetical protein